MSAPARSGRLPHLRSDESGLGLPELLVATLLLGILSVLVVSSFSSFTSTFTRTQLSTDSTNVAAVGMNEVSRVIRSGTEIEVLGSANNRPVFVSASREDAILYSYLDALSTSPAPIMARFSVHPTTRDLLEERWPATKVNGYWTFPSPASTPASARVVARQIVVPAVGEAPLFTYLKTAGCAAAQPTCDIVPASGDALDAAEIESIVAVQITMKVQADSLARAEPVTISNRVGIPNLGISRVGL